jgi:hypothetical protein
LVVSSITDIMIMSLSTNYGASNPYNLNPVQNSGGSAGPSRVVQNDSGRLENGEYGEFNGTSSFYCG